MRIFQQSSGELHKQTVTVREAVQTDRDFTNDSTAVSETGKWLRQRWRSPDELNNHLNYSTQSHMPERFLSRHGSIVRGRQDILLSDRRGEKTGMVGNKVGGEKGV